MRNLIFYRQQRADGGIRTGVEIDGETVLGLFDDTQREMDPALVWYIDLEFFAEQLPDETELVRQWLLTKEGPVSSALRDLASSLSEGTDILRWPIVKDYPLEGGDDLFMVRCSAVRRLEARNLGRYLTELAENWPRVIASLHAADVAALGT